MHRTRVPVVAVNEDGDSPSGKHNVGCAARCKLAMQPKPNPSCMEGSTERQLWLGVGLPTPAKVPAYRRADP